MILQPPLLSELERGRRILLAGAGGGYDVFSGLPLYFALRDAGKEVTLANLSFSHLQQVEESVTEDLKKVTADSSGSVTYFPERYLCEWFRRCVGEVPIYAIERTGVIPIREGYQRLIEELDIDTVLLVDGGTDSLMRGDEEDLGTPHEDVASIAAVADLEGPERKLMACVGFGIDHFHGVCHTHFLEAVAELTCTGDFLGTFSVLPESMEAKLFRQASRYVFDRMPKFISIVTSSILAAIDGCYGDHHSTERTRGSELWINPLMAIYWGFRLEGVAERILYLDAMKETWTYIDVDDVIEAFRIAHPGRRPYREIPL